MMESAANHDVLDDLLRRCGTAWSAAQVHGLVSGRLAVKGSEGRRECVEQVLAGTEAASADQPQCKVVLDDLFRETHLRLADRQSEFELLLPNDEEATDLRTAALAHWCEGYLHGLVAAAADDEVRQRLASEPIAGIIRDLLQITRASAGADDDVEGDEAAYTEVVEYLRVAAQVVYEELADLRSAPTGSPESLH